MPSLIVALFVFIHGAIHLCYLAPRPPQDGLVEASGYRR